MVGDKGTVCVTGGAGFVASWLIMRLLQHGYSVRATVRSDPKFKEDTTHLLNLPEAPEKLKIFDADLTNPETFDPIIEGCTGVFHVAHPMDTDGRIPCEITTKIALEGTLGVLKACLKSKTVKRVVYTSSIASAMCIGTMNDGKGIDESVWSDVDLLKSLNYPELSYAISKTATEKAALEFAEENGLDLVTILPAAVVGPFLASSPPIGVSLALALVFGDEKQCMMGKQLNLVHIDDVAAAQIFLFESPKAEGRHICSSDDTTIHGIAKFLSVKYPEFQMPDNLLSRMKEEKPIHLSSKKLLDMGFKFKYGMEDMYDGAINCCREKGLLYMVQNLEISRECFPTSQPTKKLRQAQSSGISNKGQLSVAKTKKT